MTVTDTLPTYRPVAGGETQLSEFPAAPQFGVESATPQPQMVYMAQPGSGFPVNVQAVHVIQPPGEDPNQHDLCLAIAWFVIGFIVPLVWLGGHMLWNRYSFSLSRRISHFAIVRVLIMHRLAQPQPSCQDHRPHLGLVIQRLVLPRDRFRDHVRYDDCRGTLFELTQRL